MILLSITRVRGFAYTASNTNAEGNDMASVAPGTMQIAAEEGRLKGAVNSSESLDSTFEGSSHPPINYPVGKPLEVK